MRCCASEGIDDPRRRGAGQRRHSRQRPVEFGVASVGCAAVRADEGGRARAISRFKLRSPRSASNTDIVGVQCGLMDQAVIALARTRRGAAVRLRRSSSSVDRGRRTRRFGSSSSTRDARDNWCIRHTTRGCAKRVLRPRRSVSQRSCSERLDAADTFERTRARDQMTPSCMRRARHVVSEARASVAAAADALGASRLDGAGRAAVSRATRRCATISK